MPRRASNRAGISLLEVLVALAILSVLLLTATRAFDGPSPNLQARGFASKLVENAGIARQTAIRNRTEVRFVPSEFITNCEGEPAKSITFFPDGSAMFFPMCVQLDELALVLVGDPLTGQIVIE